MDDTGTVNIYGRQLTEEEIRRRWHRECVGGAWEELGRLQFDYLRRQGLQPHHLILDVGCGALRGGVHFARYLEESHYYGIDINASLIEAGRRELEEAGVAHKRPNLAVNAKFEFCQFGQTFDFALAQSVFTHLPFNHIIRCLVEIRKVLKPTGTFYATFFDAPSPGHLDDVAHAGGTITHFDSDPYHQSFSEVEWMAGIAGLHARPIGDWQHPYHQRMLAFTP